MAIALALVLAGDQWAGGLVVGLVDRSRSADPGPGVLVGGSVPVAVGDRPQSIGPDEHNPIVPADGANPWPAAWEADYQARGRDLIRQFANPKSYGNTFFENEKKSYPRAMLDGLAGNRARAIAFLQEPDQMASTTAHTLGIDLYPSFTLKGQVRKYFYFGPWLDPAYRDRMHQSLVIWTRQDPLTQHFDGPRPFWSASQDNCKTWVDCRNTDNLRSMREVAVYLFAMAAGQTETAQIYRDRLLTFSRNLYTIGQGEWDSGNYWGHTFTAWLNLYDFAPEPAVRSAAKATLDWLSITAALKYWRGGFGGPSKRDGANAPRAALATKLLSLYFGEAIAPDPDPEPDVVYALTSGYRPPAVAVAIARKQFDRPRELWASKPTYEHWKKDGRSAPAYFETLYFGQTFQLGSLAQGSGGDLNGFKLLAWNQRQGVDYGLASSGFNPAKISTHQHPNSHDAIGQFGPRLIWLNDNGRAPFQWRLPAAIATEQAGDWSFWFFEKTWLALRPIALSPPQRNAEATASVAQKQPGQEIWTAQGNGAGPVSGWAIEVGELGPTTEPQLGQYVDRAAFRQAVLSRSHLDLSRLAQRTVTFTASNGDRLGLTHRGRNLPIVTRNGQAHDWRHHYASYQAADGRSPLIEQAWESGQLRAIAGSYSFTGGFTGGNQPPRP